MLLKNCPFNVANSIEAWLRTHGKSIRPELSSEQKADLEECFDLIDADGSGAIDVDELNTAFKVLGLKMKKKDIEKLMNDVDADGSGEVEYEEFVEIMTTTLEKRSNRDDAEDAGDRGAASPAPLPFELLATAYRRKKLLEAVMGGDRQQRNRMSAKAARAIHAAEEREREVLELEALAKLAPKPQPRKSRMLLQRVLNQNKQERAKVRRARKAAARLLKSSTVVDLAEMRKLKNKAPVVEDNSPDISFLTSVQNCPNPASQDQDLSNEASEDPNVTLPPVQQAAKGGGSPDFIFRRQKVPDVLLRMSRSEIAKTREWLEARPMDRHEFLVPLPPEQMGSPTSSEVGLSSVTRRKFANSNAARQRSHIRLQAVHETHFPPPKPSPRLLPPLEADLSASLPATFSGLPKLSNVSASSLPPSKSTLPATTGNFVDSLALDTEVRIKAVSFAPKEQQGQEARKRPVLPYVPEGPAPEDPTTEWVTM